MVSTALGPYFDVHQAPTGPGDARPTAEQILRDNHAIGAHADKTFLVTGGTDGLGKETVIQLAKTGARVVFTARNVAKAEGVVEEIRKLGEADAELKGARVEFVEMDLASLKSVQAGAEGFLRKSERLNVLVCNAGLGGGDSKTQDGFESAFGINHLAHFYLFHLLEAALIAAATPAFQSRVVVVSSLAHHFSRVQFGDYAQTRPLPEGSYLPAIAMPGRAFNPLAAYGQSKTANIYFANEVDRRFGSRGVRALSLHPGNIQTAGWASMWADLGPDGQAVMTAMMTEDITKAIKDVGQGAATQVWAAIGTGLEGKGGVFLEDCGVAQPQGDDGGIAGYASYAFDPEAEKRLWTESLEMVGLKGEQ